MARGSDSWLGRTIYKDFGAHDIFKGRVNDVEENSSKNGHHVFHVVYEDDDDEWMEPDELAQLLSVCA